MVAEPVYASAPLASVCTPTTAHGVRRTCGSGSGADFDRALSELLGEDAASMTNQDIEDIRRHAETMAGIVVEMYQEECRAFE